MHEQQPTAGILTTGTLQVRLEGGPTDIPRQLDATHDEIADGKIKVAYLAGYEHFVRKITDDAAYLFAWTTRTKMAE